MQNRIIGQKISILGSGRLCMGHKCNADSGLGLFSSDYPVSWEGLMELLEDCKLSQIVVELRTALVKAANI